MTNMIMNSSARRHLLQNLLEFYKTQESDELGNWCLRQNCSVAQNLSDSNSKLNRMVTIVTNFIQRYRNLEILTL